MLIIGLRLAFNLFYFPSRSSRLISRVLPVCVPRLLPLCRRSGDPSLQHRRHFGETQGLCGCKRIVLEELNFETTNY
ncbi:hypothetical protein AGOR_G00160000 [Albula goreensis]|uniref:Uncharacterized protein n=1 Tax=Albula goreensis TaxID=1534307 RepID=A0A8T3D0A1_9TELE|nr:hypothetical protein AGOR_G00160000 [Albula goreensis]